MLYGNDVCAVSKQSHKKFVFITRSVCVDLAGAISESDFIMLIFTTFELFEIDRRLTSHLKDIFKSFPNHSFFFRINVDLIEIYPTELDALFFTKVVLHLLSFSFTLRQNGA